MFPRSGASASSATHSYVSASDNYDPDEMQRSLLAVGLLSAQTKRAIRYEAANRLTRTKGALTSQAASLSFSSPTDAIHILSVIGFVLMTLLFGMCMLAL
jgi:hypothetical protein